MDNEEYKRGYRDGYRDGMSATRTNKFSGPRCFKCGVDFTGFMGYVCSRNDCPMILSAVDPEWKKDHDRSKY